MCVAGCLGTTRYGPPIYISDDLVELHKKDPRAACNAFLGHVEDGMRGALVTTDSYDTLTLVHTARRLFQRDYESISAAQKQDLNRRFSEGYKLLLTRNDGDLPPELRESRQRLINYRDTLQARGGGAPGSRRAEQMKRKKASKKE